MQIFLLPNDPHDSANIFLEIRAGTGGEEAALFVGDLYKMYSKFAEKNSFVFMQCNNCEYVFLDPLPDADSSYKFYNDRRIIFYL